MIVIVGGRGQGKLDFALELSGEKTYADGEVCDFLHIADNKVIYNYHLFIKRNCCDYEKLINPGDDKIIVLNEIGSTVVPISKEERDYIDLVGKVGRELTKKADKVYRLFCGIPTRIK